MAGAAPRLIGWATRWTMLYRDWMAGRKGHVAEHNEIAKRLVNVRDFQTIQAAIDYAKPDGIPVYFPPGDYVLSEALNFTGGKSGWRIYGAGKLVTRIHGNLTEAYPVMDCANTMVCLEDLHILGGGEATCGVLLARGHDASGYHGDDSFLQNVMVSGTFSKAAVANIGADLSCLVHCALYGPISYFIGCTPNSLVESFGFASKFVQDIGGDSTLHELYGCTLVANERCGVLNVKGAVEISGCTCALSGAATALVELADGGMGYGKATFLRNSRLEVDSSVRHPVHILNVVNGSSGGVISGQYGCVKGPYINIQNGQYLQNYDINFAPGNLWDFDTALATDGAQGDDHIHVNSSDGFADGDCIEIMLNAGGQINYVNGTPIGDLIALKHLLSGPSNAGHKVYRKLDLVGGGGSMTDSMVRNSNNLGGRLEMGWNNIVRAWTPNAWPTLDLAGHSNIWMGLSRTSSH